jgi:hypothetical protein
MDLIHPPLFPLFPSPPTSTHRLTGSVSQSCPSFYRLCSLFTVTTLYMSLLVAIPALWSESGHTRHHHQCDHSGTGVWLVVERVLIIAKDTIKMAVKPLYPSALLWPLHSRHLWVGLPCLLQGVDEAR